MLELLDEAVRFRVSTKGNGFLPCSNSIGKEPITLSTYPKSNSLFNTAEQDLCSRIDLTSKLPLPGGKRGVLNKGTGESRLNPNTDNWKSWLIRSLENVNDCRFCFVQILPRTKCGFTACSSDAKE